MHEMQLLSTETTKIYRRKAGIIMGMLQCVVSDCDLIDNLLELFDSIRPLYTTHTLSAIVMSSAPQTIASTIPVYALVFLLISTKARFILHLLLARLYGEIATRSREIVYLSVSLGGTRHSPPSTQTPFAPYASAGGTTMLNSAPASIKRSASIYDQLVQQWNRNSH
jgi:hypothetical protein